MAAACKREGSDPTGSPNSDPTFPSAPNSWRREDLLALNINIEQSFLNPKDIVDMIISSRRRFGNNDTWRVNKANLDARIDKITDAVGDTLAFQLLNSHFDCMTMKDDAVFIVASRDDAWKFRGIEDPGFKTAFEAAGAEFTERLLVCIEQKENEEIISQKMFQHLFISFLRLFNLTCQFDPLLPTRNLNICGSKLSGVPDITAYWLDKVESTTSQPTFDWKTLFICEVKKDFDRDDTPPVKVAKSTEKDTIPLVSPVHISDTLLGQHGAELLMCYKSSVVKNVIIGMIVEETHVTFTALSMTEKQYKQIVHDGTASCDKVNGPKLIFTKSYDYLIKQDRKCLLKAFLKLGYLQKFGSEFFW